MTASSAGIGRAIAEELAGAGADIVVHGRRPETAEAAATELHAWEWISGDLGTADGTESVRSWLADNDIDVLVNGAGPFEEHTYETASPQNWVDTYQSNVVSAVTLARAVLPGMRRRGFGRVVFIGTRATRTPIPTMIDYSAAKAALANATISLARSAGAPDVTVNMFSPGMILTPSLRAMFGQRPEYAGMAWEDIEPQVTSDYAPNPTGRLGRPEDIAKGSCLHRRNIRQLHQRRRPSSRRRPHRHPLASPSVVRQRSARPLMPRSVRAVACGSTTAGPLVGDSVSRCGRY